MIKYHDLKQLIAGESLFWLIINSRELDSTLAGKQWYADKSKTLAGHMFHPYTGSRENSKWDEVKNVKVIAGRGGACL